jgi:hypothetical protein
VSWHHISDLIEVPVPTRRCLSYGSNIVDNRRLGESVLINETSSWIALDRQDAPTVNGAGRDRLVETTYAGKEVYKSWRSHVEDEPTRAVWHDGSGSDRGEEK